MAEELIIRQNDTRPATPVRRDTSIDYLRTTLTLMVLAHHSSLAYTTFAHFDKQDLSRSTDRGAGAGEIGRAGAGAGVRRGP